MKTLILLLLWGLRPSIFAANGYSVIHTNEYYTIRDGGSETISKDRNGQVTAKLHQPFLNRDTLFLPISLVNRSSISFEVDFLKFYVRDRLISKRTVIQDLELVPIGISGLPEGALCPGGKAIPQIALPKFTLPRGKELRIEIFERQGSRHLTLSLNRKDIENARQVGQ